jgi:hypothetical protein
MWGRPLTEAEQKFATGYLAFVFTARISIASHGDGYVFAHMQAKGNRIGFVSTKMLARPKAS